MPVLDDSLAESLSAVWSALHRDTELIIRRDEFHHLRMLALAADDDLVSHLLLRKLQVARVEDDASADTLVALNSFCEFTFDGAGQRFCQLVHPSPYAPNYGLSVVSLLGAGLLGVRAGQTILWPGEAGTLHHLHVARVENCPGLGDWLGLSPGKERVHA